MADPVSRYWSPKFGTVLRHDTGQIVMIIGPDPALPPYAGWAIYLGGPRHDPTKFIKTFAFRSDTHEWERIKKGTEP